MTRKDFYKTKAWSVKRKEIRIRDNMICQHCGRPVPGITVKDKFGRSYTRYGIVDHIIELTDENFMDPEISLNNDNLELLCLDCHNTKTFGSQYVKNGKFQFDARPKEIDLPTFD